MLSEAFHVQAEVPSNLAGLGNGSILCLWPGISCHCKAEPFWTVSLPSRESAALLSRRCSHLCR